MNQLIKWFEGLQQREQVMVSVAGAFVLVAIFYFAAWMPLQNSLEKARKGVTSKAELVTWMQEAANKVKQAQRGGAGNRQDNRPLMQLLNTTGRQQGFNFARIEPKSDSEVQLMLDEVKFDDFINWLGMLNNRYQIHVDQVTVNTINKPGYVKVNIRLMR